MYKKYVSVSACSEDNKEINSFLHIYLTLPQGGGAFKARPEQESRFWHLFEIQMTQKN